MTESGRLAATHAVTDALQAHAADLRRFVRARAPAADVDDVLQVAAMRAVERAVSLKDPARVLPWLYRIHRNTIVDTLRKSATVEQWMDRGAEPPEGTAPPPQAADLCDCSVVQAQRLSPGYASILTLVDVRGVSLRDAADSIGITVNNATVRLHRARKALRKAMLDHCGVQSARDCMDCRCVDEGCCAS